MERGVKTRRQNNHKLLTFFCGILISHSVCNFPCVLSVQSDELSENQIIDLIIQGTSGFPPGVDLPSQGYEVFEQKVQGKTSLYVSTRNPTKWTFQRESDDSDEFVVVIDKGQDQLDPSETNTFIVLIQSIYQSDKYTAHKAYLRTINGVKSIEWDLFETSPEATNKHSNFITAFKPSDFPWQTLINAGRPFKGSQPPLPILSRKIRAFNSTYLDWIQIFYLFEKWNKKSTFWKLAPLPYGSIPDPRTRCYEYATKLIKYGGCEYPNVKQPVFNDTYLDWIEIFYKLEKWNKRSSFWKFAPLPYGQLPDPRGRCYNYTAKLISYDGCGYGPATDAPESTTIYYDHTTTPPDPDVNEEPRGRRKKREISLHPRCRVYDMSDDLNTIQTSRSSEGMAGYNPSVKKNCAGSLGSFYAKVGYNTKDKINSSRESESMNDIRRIMDSLTIDNDSQTGHPLFEFKKMPFTGFYHCQFEKKEMKEFTPWTVVEFYLTTLRAQCNKDIRKNTLRLFQNNIVSLRLGKQGLVQLNLASEIFNKKVLNREEWEEFFSAVSFAKYTEAFTEEQTRLDEGRESVAPNGEVISNSVQTLVSLVEKTLVLLKKKRFEYHAVKITRTLVDVLNMWRKKNKKQELILKMFCESCYKEMRVNKEDFKLLKLLSEYVIFGTLEVIKDSMSFHEFYKNNT